MVKFDLVRPYQREQEKVTMPGRTRHPLPGTFPLTGTIPGVFADVANPGTSRDAVTT